MISTFFPVKSESETCFPSESGRVKAGAFVCSAIMVISCFGEWLLFGAVTVQYNDTLIHWPVSFFLVSGGLTVVVSLFSLIKEEIMLQ